MMSRNKFILIAILLFILSACRKEQKSVLFEDVASRSGIVFENKLTYDRNFNIYTYRNFYNGGGVAIGDINNDGLPDVYLTSNMEKNKLFINRGNFKFEDISAKAGIEGKNSWSTGVAMADVNGDGWLDIYVCNSGDVAGDNKQNELFVNNKNGTFTDKAVEFGLADQGYSTHASFFDYDKDGDLDMYLLNNSYQAIGSFNLQKKVRDVRDEKGGDKLFRNDGGKFVDVSSQAGIYGSVIGFGLGVTVGDVNMDGWPDIFVSNDFFERDYLYINQKNGTFKEDLTNQMKSISVASMGADMADINNDLFPDIFVTEMLPGDDARLKTKTTFEDFDKYSYNLENDYYHQFTRNMLHLNQNGQGFLEIGRYANVEATDWSWGALMCDFDNDGKKDIFVSNGIYKDLTDQDFLNFIASEEAMSAIIKDNKVDYKKLIDVIPSEKIPNYLFKNIDGVSFRDISASSGISTPSFSNGSAYGDLDLDGDLDLVVNNVNMPTFVYKNNQRSIDTTSAYIQLDLKGRGNNTHAVGAKVFCFSPHQTLYQELMPMRGFQSSMDYAIHLGLGKTTKVDSIIVVWPNDFTTKIVGPKLNKRYHLEEPSNGIRFNYGRFQSLGKKRIFTEDIHVRLPFIHRENKFVDFNNDRLIYHMMSTAGPAMTIADFNGDNMDDVFIGGAKDQAAGIYLQNTKGNFIEIHNEVFIKDAASEDVRSSAIDVNGDGLKDIYVCSGGSEFSQEAEALIDRLYINKGNGHFEKSKGLPSLFSSTSAVAVTDIDNDGDEDIFVGERLKIFQYGIPCNGTILINDKGVFRDKTQEIAHELKNIGMITDATWVDIDNNGFNDLLIVGDYMVPHVFLNDGKKLFDKSSQYLPSNCNGWWNSIKAEDLNGDGKKDILLGNLGTNTRFKANAEHPICMYVNDFDGNGSVEQIICKKKGEKYFPMALKHDLVEQLPSLKKKFLKYQDYKDKSIDQIFDKEILKKSLVYFCDEQRSIVLANDGEKFRKIALPEKVQWSSTYDFEVGDFNHDGIVDLILGGNLNGVKPEVGRYDASNGLLLLGKGNFEFDPVPYYESGFTVAGEIRNISKITIANEPYLLVARNNDGVKFFKIGNEQ